jgi:negative regulator of flagellin synthesis FlgM
MANEISGLRQAGLQPAQARPLANALVGGHAQTEGERGSSDMITLTDAARLMHRVEQAIKNAPHVDSERIDRIKQQIASGDYQVNPDELAKRIAQFEDGFGHRDRSVEASRTENGFTYTVSTTTARGTRERTVTIGHDPDSDTLSRDITRTNVNGETVMTRHGELTATDDGYTTHGTLTRKNGESVSRQVDVSVDREAHTLTRVATVDGVNQDYVRTTVFSRDESGELTHHTEIKRLDNGLT